MNEMHGLDTLGQAGEATPRTSPRKQTESGDFASQFMAMLFDDSPARTSSRPERPGRAKVSRTETDTKKTSPPRSDQTGEANEVAPQKKSNDKGSDNNAFFQISADQLARRVLSGAFGTDETGTGSGSEKAQKRVVREDDGEPVSSKVDAQSDADSETDAKAAAELRSRWTEGSGRPVERAGREGAAHGGTHRKRSTGRGSQQEGPDEGLPETGDTQRMSNTRSVRPGEEASVVGGKVRHAATRNVSVEAGPSHLKTGASGETRSPGALSYPYGRSEDVVSSIRDELIDAEIDAEGDTSGRRGRVDRGVARAFHDSVSVRQPETDGVEVDPTRAEPKDVDVSSDAQRRASHTGDKLRDPGALSLRSADPGTTRQAILQGLASTITHQTGARSGKAAHAFSIEARAGQDHRSGESRVHVRSTTAHPTTRTDVDGSGTAHGQTSARHDSRPASPGANHRSPQSSEGQDASHEAAARREVDGSQGHRQEPESARISRPSAPGHETAPVKEGAHTGTEALAGTPLKGDLVGSSIRSVASHSSPSAAGSPDFGKILNQIVDTARLERGAGMNRFTIQLKPDFLGRIEIQTELSDDAVMQAVIRVEDPYVRKTVEAGLTHLVHKLNELGLDISSAKVADFMPQNDGQGQQQPNPGSPGTKSRHNSSSGRGFAAASDREEGPIAHDDESFSYFA